MNPIIKISLKDVPPLTTIQRKTLKLFESEHNIVKARLSFKKISIIGEALDIWGKRGNVAGFERSEALDFNKVETLYILLYNELVSSFANAPAPRKPLTDKSSIANETWLGEIWNTNDSLIESDFGVTETLKELYDTILPPHNPKQKAVLYPFQLNAAKESFWKIVKEHHNAILCPGKVGEGKTFYAGQLIRWLLDSGYINSEKNFSPWRVLYVTKATIVEQTKEELTGYFGLRPIVDITVTNYEQLRADLGDMMIEDTIVVEDGIERHNYKWRPYLHPMLFIWDECHSLKNEDSIQSRIAQAVNDIVDNTNVIQIFMSATPFSRVAHAKAFAVGTHKKYKGALGGESSITNTNWQSFAKRIASPADPNDYCKAAIKRLLKEFADYIVPFKNVRQKHKAILRTISIDFESESDRKAYALAWEAYLEAKAKIGAGDSVANSRFLILVQFLKFRQAAELIRSHYIARSMHEAWTQGYAPVYACNFKASIAKVVNYLCNDYNIPRDKISLIWGGDKAFGGSEEKYSKEEIHNILAACMRGDESVSVRILKEIQHQLMTEASGLSDLDASLKLGVQSKNNRWNEIKRFQSGKSEFCMFSYKSGGAGISLHQNKPTLRPRKQYNSPTYNEMEMQQAEGRTCRLTSLNDVEIDTLVYRGTIEVPVMQRVTTKRQCLNVVMGVGNVGGSLDKVQSAAQERELEAIINLLDTRSKEEKEEDQSKEMYEDDDEDKE